MDLDSKQIKEEFELREKRLNMIYKVLYLVAAIWTVLLISYTSNPVSAAPIYCGLLATLTTVIANIIFYAFSEFRCFTITKRSKDKNEDINFEREVADEKFLNVWNSFIFALWPALLFMWINLTFQQIVSLTLITVVAIIGSVAIVLISFLNIFIGS